MKTVELSDEAFAALEQLARTQGAAPADVLTALLTTARPLSGDHLLFYLAGPAFSTLTDRTERYLALLGWVARNYASDFAYFVSHQESAGRYLMLPPAAVHEVRARNQARQIEGTPFWAVMTIDDATRRRFVARLLEFIGCHDDTVAQALRALDSQAGSALTGAA